jgi:hypothetical protein
MQWQTQKINLSKKQTKTGEEGLQPLARSNVFRACLDENLDLICLDGWLPGLCLTSVWLVLSLTGSGKGSEHQAIEFERLDSDTSAWLCNHCE